MTNHSNNHFFLPDIINNNALAINLELNGHNGRNRELSRPCQINADNDLAAIKVWLKEYSHRPNTHRAYVKEVERLLLWCCCQHKKALSNLQREDLDAYFSFLENPEPRALWCGQSGGRGVTRLAGSWKPFTGPLSSSAKSTAITIINSMFKYLVMANYLAFNPISLMRNRSTRQTAEADNQIKVVERMLELDEWQALLSSLEAMDETEQHALDYKERLKFIIGILFLLGLRISELEQHTWNAFREVQGDWWFFVRGKGGKLGKIPVNQELLSLIQHYRTYLRLSPLPSATDLNPLVSSWNSNKALSASSMAKQIKQLALVAADQFVYEPNKRSKLQKFSPHWLRHFSASMQDKSGIDFKHIKANHRHSSDETTRRYIHSMDKERHQAMEKLTFGLT